MIHYVRGRIVAILQSITNVLSDIELSRRVSVPFLHNVVQNIDLTNYRIDFQAP
jgi:ribosomal 30S subunit maturation factor RimM